MKSLGAKGFFLFLLSRLTSAITEHIKAALKLRVSCLTEYSFASA
jgi:hypothetical protein